MRLFTLCTMAVCLTLYAFGSFFPSHKISKSVDQIQTKTQKISKYFDKWCKNPYSYCDYKF